jgi:hypothetical protein
VETGLIWNASTTTHSGAIGDFPVGSGAAPETVHLKSRGHFGGLSLGRKIPFPRKRRRR